ncbi:hypothetical protein [Flammeovirga sp. EKP202]|uniref:hypothetical protein n=1 Tax=Flammeovirga sp. EKP202 TaxID=2770592 RepID=UPI00165FFBF0|nr:hypothetical protein [Flammeovirga sp. EKP202]MBD0401576.1 hypothetical protein [Flammeovirga sp. EKP202]
MKIIYTLVLLLLTTLPLYQITAQDSQSFLNQKLVLALNNPLLSFSTESGNLQKMRYETLFGSKESHLNGRYRTQQPNITFMVNPMTPDDAVAYEIKVAKEMGIDGFKFPLVIDADQSYMDRAIKNITYYVTSAVNRKLDFTFSIELILKRDPASMSEDLMYDVLQNRLKEIFQKTKYSDKWLRSSDNKIVVFTKSPLHVLDKTRVAKEKELTDHPEMIKEIHTTLKSISSSLNTKLTYVFETKYPANQRFNEEVLKLFPAISQSKQSMASEENVNALKNLCKSNNKPFIQNVFPDHLSSQMRLKKNDQLVQENSEVSKGLTLNDVYVTGQDLKLTHTYRNLLQSAVDNDAAMINLMSWNYFDDGSHIAPEAHHGFGYGMLLRHYKKMWLDEEDQGINRELLMTSYKATSSKHISKTRPEVKYTVHYLNKEEQEDRIEVLTILREPGEVYCNGKLLGEAPAGIHAFYASHQEGEVSVELKRGAKEIMKYTTPKVIKSNAEKIDWMTYSFTNLDEKIGLYYQNIVLDFEIKQMYRRFIVSEANQKIWRNALQKRYIEKMNALYVYGDTPQKFLSNCKKIDKKYKETIRTILDSFQFKVWLEMEENVQKNMGISTIIDPMNDVLLEGESTLDEDDI